MQADVGFGVMLRYLPSWVRGAENYSKDETRVWRACKLLRSESRDTQKELRNSRRTRLQGRRTSQGHQRTRTRLLRMNCCKLRYMKILGGIKAVPVRPNLTNVNTRTPFMTEGKNEDTGD